MKFQTDDIFELRLQDICKEAATLLSLLNRPTYNHQVGTVEVSVAAVEIEEFSEAESIPAPNTPNSLVVVAFQDGEDTH